MSGTVVDLRPEGLYSAAGGFHIDPSRSVGRGMGRGVERALITHAHSDHARRGAREYFCAAPGVGLLSERLRIPATRIRGISYGEVFQLGEALVSFHPAGHVLGSAQVRIEVAGEVWVVSGDYKREQDPSCAPFEVVRCDTFITEGTFADPIYEWEDSAHVCRKIFEWWEEARAEGATAVLFCYALGKAQRVLAELLRFTDRPVWVAPEIEAMNRCYRDQGISLLPTQVIEGKFPLGKLSGELLLTPPHFFSESPALRTLGRIRTARVSGWERSRRSRRHRFADFGADQQGFALSDHADWPALLRTVEETGARSVYVLADKSERLSAALRKKGLFASRMALHETDETDVETDAGTAGIQGDLFGEAVFRSE